MCVCLATVKPESSQHFWAAVCQCKICLCQCSSITGVGVILHKRLGGKPVRCCLSQLVAASTATLTTITKSLLSSSLSSSSSSALLLKNSWHTATVSVKLNFIKVDSTIESDVWVQPPHLACHHSPRQPFSTVLCLENLRSAHQRAHSEKGRKGPHLRYVYHVSCSQTDANVSSLLFADQLRKEALELKLPKEHTPRI